jgi:eukaryotic-like serine/threonine-protein kinase
VELVAVQDGAQDQALKTGYAQPYPSDATARPIDRGEAAGVSEPPVGGAIAGYRIESVLGRGGMGVVYRAVDERLGRSVALKVMLGEQSGDEDFRRRFIRESRSAAAIDHPNVLPVYEAGEADGVLFLATRLVEGADLRELLAREGPLTTARTLDLVAQIAAALDAAHARGLVHRDVKPANVLVAPDSGPARSEHCYLTDFGLAKLVAGRSALTGTGQFVGTLDYIAPEQLQGKDVDGRADVYALGAVLFECLTAAPPFQRDIGPALMWAHMNDPPPRASELRPELGPGVDAVVGRAMAKRPEARYGTCAELVHAARAALDGHGPAAPVAPPPAPRPLPAAGKDASTVVADGPPPDRRRRRGVVAAAAAAVVLVAVIALGWTLLRPSGGDAGPVRMTVADAVWTARADGPIVSTPALSAGSVVVGSDDGSVRSLDARSGEPRWQRSTKGEVRSSPVVADGRVYVGSFDGSVHAFRASDGRPSWSAPTGFQVFSSPAVSGRTVVVGAEEIVALDARSGDERWRARTGGPVNSSPAIADGTVYVGADDGRLYAVDLDSGDRRWTRALGDRVYSSPAVAGGVVYVGSSKGLHAVDAATGAVRWTFASREGISSSPVVSGSTVYVGSRDRKVYAVDAASGRKRWEFSARDRVDSSPAIAGGIVYAGANDGVVYGLDAGSGAERWRFEAADPVVASPVPAEGTVIVATDGGAVYAVPMSAP